MTETTETVAGNDPFAVGRPVAVRTDHGLEKATVQHRTGTYFTLDVDPDTKWRHRRGYSANDRVMVNDGVTVSAWTRAHTSEARAAARVAVAAQVAEAAAGRLTDLVADFSGLAASSPSAGNAVDPKVWLKSLTKTLAQISSVAETAAGDIAAKPAAGK